MAQTNSAPDPAAPDPAPDLDGPLLDLDTLIERPRIRIDGEMHEILSHHELTVLDSHRLAAWGRAFDKLMKGASLNARQEARLGELVEMMSAKIMTPVPAEIRAKLTQAQKLQVTELFTGLLLRSRLEAARVASNRTADKRTGAN